MMRRRGGVVRTVGRTAVIAGTAGAVSGGIHHRQQKRWAAKEQDQYAEQQATYDQAYNQGAAAAAPPAPAGGESDSIAQLKQLADLKQQGILTDEEFAAQKAKILGT